jgi:hypothetical protein
MSWQLKGWLWLAAALVAATLAAGTSGTAPERAAQTTAARLPCTSAVATHQPEMATAASKPSSCWHNG